MEHDENEVIGDADGTMGDDERTMDVDPEETAPKPYIVARNMRIAQLKQRFAEVERSA